MEPLSWATHPVCVGAVTPSRGVVLADLVKSLCGLCVHGGGEGHWCGVGWAVVWSPSLSGEVGLTPDRSPGGETRIECTTPVEVVEVGGAGARSQNVGGAPPCGGVVVCRRGGACVCALMTCAAVSAGTCAATASVAGPAGALSVSAASILGDVGIRPLLVVGRIPPPPVRLISAPVVGLMPPLVVRLIPPPVV
ncbi:hypothetical protein EYF80_061571 [Liparis tanakae]|uniref:Uncharacterized protein n=1 Tax=Liparis tanakae TaxID=230148 RepID=A0A4Z2EIW1_9TELE|nr:hypothetical protein EYF80_061571 [Liparis tanakae]